MTQFSVRWILSLNCVSQFWGPLQSAYLHAALLLAFSSLEAHVNAITEDFISRSELTPHEIGIMREKEVRLEKGVFEVSNSLKIVRLEERIEFLHARLSGTRVNRSDVWWSRLSDATKLRNKLTHPKEPLMIDDQSVGAAIQSIIDTCDALYKAIYKRGFPVAGLRLDSQLNF
jgi:hypothetical protein